MPKLGTVRAADVAYLYCCLPVCSFVLLDLVHLYGLCSAVPPSSGSWTPPLRFRSPLILLLDSEVASTELFLFLTLSEILFASLLGFCLQNFFELIQLDYCLFNALQSFCKFCAYYCKVVLFVQHVICELSVNIRNQDQNKNVQVKTNK